MSAVFSHCGKYRYRLERKLGNGKTCLFLMLNPSTAGAQYDDPTVRRCIAFAKRWGFGRLLIGNLFAFRATRVSDLKRADDPVGPENFYHLRKMCGEQHLCILAWGEHGKFLAQDARVLKSLARWGVKLHVLKLTKRGRPRHPLYLRKDIEPVRWAAP